MDSTEASQHCMTVNRVAEICRISPQAVRRLCREAVLFAEQDERGCWRIEVASAEAYSKVQADKRLQAHKAYKAMLIEKWHRKWQAEEYVLKQKPLPMREWLFKHHPEVYPQLYDCPPAQDMIEADAATSASQPGPVVTLRAEPAQAESRPTPKAVVKVPSLPSVTGPVGDDKALWVSVGFVVLALVSSMAFCFWALL